MMPLELGTTPLSEYHRALASDHWVSISGLMLDLSGRPLLNITDNIWDGQVNVDNTAEVTRGLSIKLLDPDHKFGLDKTSPGNGAALYHDRMLKIRYNVYAPFMNAPVSCDIFTGPVSSVARDGAFISVEAQGKEILAQGQAWEVKVYDKNWTRWDAAWHIITQVWGERDYDMPKYPEMLKPLSSTITLDHEASPWLAVKKIINSAGCHMFYDGRGVLKVRKYNGQPVFMFHDRSELATLLSDPQLSYDDGEMKNVFWVVGGTPKNSKEKVQASVHLPQSHPFSSSILGRNGYKRYLVQKIENDNYRTTAECLAAAQEEANKYMSQVIQVTANTLVVPHLDPYDFVTIFCEGFTTNTRMSQWSIPLGINEDMSIGGLRKVSRKTVPGHRRVTKKRSKK